ncbi:hypothetical protein SLS62_008813 [Diatrype stigma]|uniref:Uncharacterized protein n=1 Tax=Diatrype stigma TaxID=117547 RepID=A0AAN9UJR7_9PEZI
METRSRRRQRELSHSSTDELSKPKSRVAPERQGALKRLKKGAQDVEAESGNEGRKRKRGGSKAAAAAAAAEEEEEEEQEEEEEEGQDDDDEAMAGTFSSGKAKKGHKGTGVRSKYWAQHKEMLLKGFKKLPGELQEHAASFPERLLENIVSNKTWLGEKKPVVTMEVLRDRLPAIQYDDLWTEDQEQTLQESFPENDPYRRYVASNENGVTTNYWSMWRKICRLRGCFPEQIIGAGNYLEYGGQIQLKRNV